MRIMNSWLATVVSLCLASTRAWHSDVGGDQRGEGPGRLSGADALIIAGSVHWSGRVGMSESQRLKVLGTPVTTLG
jgi:hypothetical protein